MNDCKTAYGLEADIKAFAASRHIKIKPGKKMGARRFKSTQKDNSSHRDDLSSPERFGISHQIVEVNLAGAEETASFASKDAPSAILNHALNSKRS